MYRRKDERNGSRFYKEGEVLKFEISSSELILKFIRLYKKSFFFLSTERRRRLTNDTEADCLGKALQKKHCNSC